MGILPSAADNRYANRIKTVKTIMVLAIFRDMYICFPLH